MTKRQGDSEHLGVGEVKRRFSEVLSRVEHRGERFVIERRGTPVAAVVRVEDLEDLATRTEGRGLLSAAGLFEDVPELETILDEVYRSRAQAADRPGPDLDR